jgi:hypothetical protein
MAREVGLSDLTAGTSLIVPLAFFIAGVAPLLLTASVLSGSSGTVGRFEEARLNLQAEDEEMGASSEGLCRSDLWRSPVRWITHLHQMITASQVICIRVLHKHQSLVFDKRS